MMEAVSTTPLPPAVDRMPESRDCTRCDGEQHLLGEYEGMGKYGCDTCQMTVGFDVFAEPVEFLIDRGAPKFYTKKRFGPRLTKEEQRL